MQSPLRPVRPAARRLSVDGGKGAEAPSFSRRSEGGQRNAARLSLDELNVDNSVHGSRARDLHATRRRQPNKQRLLPAWIVSPCDASGIAGDLRVVNVLEAEREDSLPVLVVELA